MGEVVGYHLAAFDNNLAIAYAYDTNEVPRVPVEVILVPHRAFASYDEAREHELFPDDPAVIRVLGERAIEIVRHQRQDTQLQPI